VRILFTFGGGRGHLNPLVPIAAAAGAAGHTVAFTAGPATASTIEALGFEALTIGPRRDPEPRERRPLREVDVEHATAEFRDNFTGDGARRRATTVLARAAAWRPDVVVCEETDFGAMIAAERFGVAHATVLVLGSDWFVRPELVAEPLDARRAEQGLPPDPGLAMHGRHLVLSPFPPRYRELPENGHAFRSFEPAPAAEGQEPTVYFTLGTEFNVESGDLYSRVLAGLEQLPVRVVATVGTDIDPEELGPRPGRIRVARYVDQALVLPGCEAVVCHGGSGTVIGALAHGLPLVVIPLGADQPLNAARCEELGVARVLDPVRCTPADVRDAVSAVLAEPAYRQAAASLRDELAALPTPASAVPLLERLEVLACAR
jgi:UDP:flavonoid glycosyltransferase YjiC (YdhE family)